MPWNGPELEMARTQESRGEDGMGLVVVGLHNAAIMWRGGGKLSHRGHSLGSDTRERASLEVSSDTVSVIPAV